MIHMHFVLKIAQEVIDMHFKLKITHEVIELHSLILILWVTLVQNFSSILDLRFGLTSQIYHPILSSFQLMRIVSTS